MIRAILWAQLKSLRNAHAQSRGRGVLVSAIAAAIWYGMWFFVAFGAYQIASEPEYRSQIELSLPRVLLLVCLYWQLSPLVSASLGTSLDLRKLRVYPIPRRKLFLIETALRLSTSLEMLLVLAAGTAGLMRNGAFANSWADPPRMAAAAVGFAAMNLLVSAGTRSLIERLLARRRIQEIVVLLLVTMVAAPRLLVETRAAQRFGWLLESRGEFWLPWGAAASLMLGDGALLSAAMLAGWCGLAYGFGRMQFERSLRFDPGAARSTVQKPGERATRSERLFTLPSRLLPDPLGAVVEKELRSLTRTPRFRMVFMMGFTFGMVVWLPFVLGNRGRDSLFAQNFLTLVSVYALALLGQVSYLNSFGFDRSAVQFYYVAPVRFWQALAAKNIATLLFVLLELALVTAVSMLFVNIPAEKVGEAVLATGVAALYLLAVGNLGSVYHPRGMNPDKATGGERGKRQAITFISLPVALSPLALTYLAGYAYGTRIAFYGALALAGALGVAAYLSAMRAAVRRALSGREQMVDELSRGAGPISGD